MRNALLFLLVWLVPTGLFAQQENGKQQQSLVFSHVTVVDTTGAPSKPDMTVIIKGDRIEALGKTGALPVPSNAHVVDATGKFLIPGLWDMHVHPWLGKRYLSLFPANGVVGIRVMESSEDYYKWRKAISAGQLVGPRMVIGSPIIKADNFVAVDNEEREGRRIVRKVKAGGAAFVKVYNGVPRDAYFAIIDEAMKQGIPVAGHCPYSVTYAECSDAGQRSIEHVGVLLWGCTSLDPLKWKYYDGSLLPKRWPWDCYSEEIATNLFARFVKNETWICPTLTVPYGRRNKPEFANDPRLEYLPPFVRGAHKDHWLLARTEEERYAIENQWKTNLKVIDKMRRAGVRFLAGTDTTPMPYCLPGFGLHDELALLVEGGFSPMEALCTATYNPAKFFGKLDSMGTIEQGKTADLVLLDADPLEDIHNTQKIAAVVFGGKVFRRTDLQKVLAQVKASNLHKEAAEGHIENVTLLISQGADVNIRDQFGWTAAQAALYSMQFPMVDLLLKNGADVNDPYLASYTGDRAGIKKLLDSDVRVESLDGLTLLHAAAAGGRTDIVELLIGKGFQVTAATENNMTALCYAVMGNHQEMAKTLIANGAPMNQGQRTPLWIATSAGYKDIVELLINRGADVNAKGQDSALHRACLKNYKGLAEFLISKGADIDAKDDNGRTPLHRAAGEGYKDLAELLLANGADVNVKDKSAYTPFRYACDGNHKDVAKLLIGKETDVNEKQEHGTTLLHHAAGNGYRDIVELLIVNGANIEAKDNGGQTSLHYAAKGGHKNIVELLIAKGADVDAKNILGQTPLHYAAIGGIKNVAELLLAKGADVNALDDEAWTALHYASMHNRKDTVELLISKRADIDAKDNNGQTPLHYAADVGHNSIVEMLLSKGADFKIKDKCGKTARDTAKDKGHTEIVELLCKQEAKE